jgi:hypothetical protein
VMARLLDNTLAKNHYNWTGHYDNKHAFGVLNVKQVVIGERLCFIKNLNDRNLSFVFVIDCQ